MNKKILACLILAILAGFWALRTMTSLFGYRSPLRLTPPAPGRVLDRPVVRRLVIVLVDALREDTSHDAEVMPTLDRLRQQGAWAVMHSRPPSYSEPGYSVLLTGAWPDLSDGPAANLDYNAIYPFTQDNIFSAAHRLGIRTAVSGYYWFEKLIPAEAVDAGFFTPGEDQQADRQVVDAAMPWLESGDYGLVLIHLDQVDYAGHHEGGPLNPDWAQAAHRSDALIAEIVTHLDLGQDALMIVSDHGQIDAGGHGGPEPVVLREPFVLVGAGIHPGQYPDVQMVDVAPTSALLLGTNLPASTQGRPLAEMVVLDDEQLQTLHQAYDAQQGGLVAAYTAAIGQPSQSTGLELLNLPEIQTSYETALENAQASRLRTERTIRAVLAIPFVVGGLYLIVRTPRARLWWLLVSAMLYVLLFNLRYVLLDGRTYSLSSVSGPADLILYTGVTAWLALGAAWLVSSIGLGSSRPSSLSSAAGSAVQSVAGSAVQSAAGLAVQLALVISAVLSVPVLWSFVANGALINWILPDFPSSFAALLGLIQILFICLGGILLSGVTALVSTISKRQARVTVSIQTPEV